MPSQADDDEPAPVLLSEGDGQVIHNRSIGRAMPLALSRKYPDALPEQATFVDTGCNLAPSCLDCPFEVCRYDLPPGLGMGRFERAVEMRRLHEYGVPFKELMQMSGLSKRSVYRVLAS